MTLKGSNTLMGNNYKCATTFRVETKHSPYLAINVRCLQHRPNNPTTRLETIFMTLKGSHGYRKKITRSYDPEGVEHTPMVTTINVRPPSGSKSNTHPIRLQTFDAFSIAPMIQQHESLNIPAPVFYKSSIYSTSAVSIHSNKYSFLYDISKSSNSWRYSSSNVFVR